MPSYSAKDKDLPVLFMCDCSDTATVLEVLDWDDILIVSLSNRALGFWRSLWRLLRHGESTYLDITMKAETARELAEELVKAADRIKEKVEPPKCPDCWEQKCDPPPYINQ